MNVRGLANRAVQAISPNRSVQWMLSNGWTQDPVTLKRVPTYDTVTVTAQVQPLSSTDRQLIEGMNLNGYFRSIYLNAQAAGVQRNRSLGGDLFVFDNQTWQVTTVPEDWDNAGWCRVIVTLQQSGSSGSDNG